MPKKFQGENSKSAEAKARKDAVEKEKQATKEKEEEDKLWEDDDKHVLKKVERKEDKGKKQQEVLQRKKEREKLLEEEMAALKGSKPAPASKVTKAQIESEAEKRERLLRMAKPQDSDLVVHDEETPIPENSNRIVLDGHTASGVEAALAVLGVDDGGDVDKHPEKRARAAYAAFEEREMLRLKEEYPNFRLSQLKQMLKKEWQKSPDNPFNQPTRTYNSKPA